LVAAILCLTPTKAICPELPPSIKQSPPASAHATQISRSKAPKHERRIMIVTAYSANDAGMDGKGITASGEPVEEGRTIAADPEIAFGTKIFIPRLEHTYIVADRGSAIKGNRLDIYMESRRDALNFGVWELEIWIEK